MKLETFSEYFRQIQVGTNFEIDWTTRRRKYKKNKCDSKETKFSKLNGIVDKIIYNMPIVSNGEHVLF